MYAHVITGRGSTDYISGLVLRSLTQSLKSDDCQRQNIIKTKVIHSLNFHITILQNPSFRLCVVEHIAEYASLSYMNIYLCQVSADETCVESPVSLDGAR